MAQSSVIQGRCMLKLRSLFTILFVSVSASGQVPLPSLLRQFEETRDLAAKEKAMNLIAQQGSTAGALLLQLAKTTNDNDTRWMAIRGLGTTRFEDAAPFLVDSLDSPEPYVRANAARALGELRYSPAGPALIRLLASEQDSGVIEQTSLALEMLNVHEAIPVLKSRMSVPSLQTRCWLLAAVAELGSKDDVPFIAQYLRSADNDIGGVPLCATRALAELTGEDFGLPKSGGLFDPSAPVLKAREWWVRNEKEFGAQ